MKKATAELKTMVLARGSNLMDLYGVGPFVAARVLADAGDVARFADRNRFASWTGTAPLDASSGEQNRHRLSRAGNRRVNHVIHIAAVTQLRNDTGLDTAGRAYYRRKRSEGKKPLEALRCLKRRISDAIYRQLVADAHVVHLEGMDAGPGGHRGASHISSAAGSHPHTGTSDQPQPGPAPTTLLGFPRSVETSPLRRRRCRGSTGSSMTTPNRARFGWCSRPGSRSRRWPGTWGSTRAPWGTGCPRPGASGRVRTRR